MIIFEWKPQKLLANLLHIQLLFIIEFPSVFPTQMDDSCVSITILRFLAANLDFNCRRNGEHPVRNGYLRQLVLRLLGQTKLAFGAAKACRQTRHPLGNLMEKLLDVLEEATVLWQFVELHLNQLPQSDEISVRGIIMAPSLTLQIAILKFCKNI